MINKILVSFFFTELLIALGIALYWNSYGIAYHQVSIGPSFLSFMNTCSYELNQFKLEIPSIPDIPKIDSLQMEDTNWWNAVLNFFVAFANGFFTFLNGVVLILNFLIVVINTIIQLLQFVFILVKNLITMKDVLATS